MARLEFKRMLPEKDLETPTELAKDVAAFANSVGGTILIGADREGERLRAYAPLKEDASKAAMEAFDRAVRDPRGCRSTRRSSVSVETVPPTHGWPQPHAAGGPCTVIVRAMRSLLTLHAVLAAATAVVGQ